MDWMLYKTRLKTKLVNWFEQIALIQNREFSIDEVLFDLNKNTLDAFSAIVDVYSSGIGFEQWIENEKIRQRQKSLQGKIGELHELMILALTTKIGKREATNVEGYDRPMRIYDLYDDVSENKWIAEIKNKHNTTKGDDRKASFEKLEKGLEIVGEEYKAYYVTILRKSHNKVNEQFTPSDSTTATNKVNDKIIHMDGESFYEMVTGEIGALEKAFDILVEILDDEFGVQTEEQCTLRNKIREFSFFKIKVNINTSNETGFLYLPNIGQKAVNEIISYRDCHGLFENIEELKNVKGIGAKLYQKISTMLEV